MYRNEKSGLPFVEVALCRVLAFLVVVQIVGNLLSIIVCCQIRLSGCLYRESRCCWWLHVHVSGRNQTGSTTFHLLKKSSYTA